MIVEMGDYAWSEHIVMLDLTGHMIIWDGLFAHGDGSTGLMKVVFLLLVTSYIGPSPPAIALKHLTFLHFTRNVKRHNPRALTLDYQTYRTLGMLQRQCYNPLTLDISYF
jgi:hypothetical protein